MNQLPTQNLQVDSLAPDSADSIVSADSAMQIPDPSDYTLGETLNYIWDLLQVQLFTLQDNPVTFLKLLIFLLLLVGFSFLASFVKRE